MLHLENVAGDDRAAFGRILMAPFLSWELMIVFIPPERAVVGTAGWLGRRQAESLSPFQPSLAIYHLSALLLWDIKQVPWEAARDPEALSLAVWGIVAPRGHSPWGSAKPTPLRGFGISWNNQPVGMGFGISVI